MTAATSRAGERSSKDLRNLWARVGRGNEVAGGVLRACGMTLMVAPDARGGWPGVAAHARRTDARSSGRAIVLG